MPKLTNPAVIFDRLFAGGESMALRARRQAYQSSVLDYFGIRVDPCRQAVQAM